MKNVFKNLAIIILLPVLLGAGGGFAFNYFVSNSPAGPVGASVFFPYQGGTGTGTVFTAGSIVFAGASGGLYTQDNTNLAFDDTANRLLARFASVSVDFEVSGTASISAFRLPRTTGGTLGDCDAAGDTLNWDTTTGKFACGTDATGSVASDSLGFGAFVQNMVLDMYTSVSFGAFNYEFNLDSTGDFIISDNDVNWWTFHDTSGASSSRPFELSSTASISFYLGTGITATGDCNDANEAVGWTTTGIFNCQTVTTPGGTDVTLADGGTGASLTDPNFDAVFLWDDSAGATVLAGFSSGNKATTTATPYLTVGSNSLGFGEWLASASLDSHSELVFANLDYVLNLSGTGDWRWEDNGTAFATIDDSGNIDFGSAGTLEIANGTAETFSQIGQIYFDTTDFQIQIASAAANSPRVVTTMPIIWSASLASTSSQFNSGGRYYLPIRRDKYNISEIRCDVIEGTSVVINLSNRAGTFDSETITCDLDGASDTSIDTNSNYSGVSVMSGSLEFGTITGNVEWLNFTIYGLPAAQ